jgi:hypothetical protein
MRKILSALVALTVATALAAPMAAEARTKKKKRYYAAERYSGPRDESQQEYIADKLPIGTSRWWQQMDREGRGGQSRAN